jgi:hypothetical protein
LEPGFDTPEDVALLGFPRDLCRVVACRVHGDHACVLLDTGSPGQPYLYGQYCRRVDGRWRDGGSGNAPDWQRTDAVHAIGVIAFWGEAPPDAEAVRVVFGRESVEEAVVHGAWLAVWWSQPPPEEEWPSVEAYRVRGVWAPV